MFKTKKRFPDPSPPDPAAEICPTFLVKGDKIVDVVYTSWIDNGDGTWDLSGVTKVTTTGRIDRIVYELPIGCYVSNVGVAKGGDITFFPKDTEGHRNDATGMRECQEKPVFQEVAQFCDPELTVDA